MNEIHVGTRELKNRLSQYLRRVKAGEIVIITEHGKPVGQITPIPNDLTGRMLKLAELGVIEWNGQAVPTYQPQAVNRGEGLLSDLVLGQRE
jgi:prevent-host-death family protein